MNLRTGDGGWSPYLAGALVGVLAIASAVATTKVLGKTSLLGASTTFVRAAGMVERQVAPEHVKANAYFEKEKVKIDWQFMLVIGIFVGAVGLGGILFGAGWAVMGYCPGTSVGAIAEGRWQAVFAVLGMLLGAALYAEAYPWLQKTVLAFKDYGKIGLPEALGLNAWVLIPVVIAAFAGAFVLFEKLEKRGA
jgi:uncharacterized membrane protein YedE/YeeE